MNHAMPRKSEVIYNSGGEEARADAVSPELVARSDDAWRMRLNAMPSIYNMRVYLQLGFAQHSSGVAVARLTGERGDHNSILRAASQRAQCRKRNLRLK